MPEMIDSIHLRFLLFIIFYLFNQMQAAPSTPSTTVNCANWRELFDSGSAVLSMVGDLEDTQVPVTIKQLEESYCQRHLNTTSFMKDIARSCLKPFPKQVAGMAIYAARREVKNQCNNQTEKVKLLKSMSCLRNPQAKIASINLYKKLIRHVIYARDFIGNETVQIPYTCCTHHEFVDLSREKLIASGCNKEDVDYLIKSNENKVQESLDLVCSKWTHGSPQCLELLKQHPLKSNMFKNVQLSKSNVLPLVDILTGLSLPD